MTAPEPKARLAAKHFGSQKFSQFCLSAATWLETLNGEIFRIFLYASEQLKKSCTCYKISRMSKIIVRFAKDPHQSPEPIRLVQHNTFATGIPSLRPPLLYRQKVLLDNLTNLNVLFPYKHISKTKTPLVVTADKRQFFALLAKCPYPV